MRPEELPFSTPKPPPLGSESRLFSGMVGVPEPPDPPGGGGGGGVASVCGLLAEGDATGEAASIEFKLRAPKNIEEDLVGIGGRVTPPMLMWPKPKPTA